MTLARSVMMGQEPYRSVGGCERAVSSTPLQGTQGAREGRNDSNFGVPTVDAVSCFRRGEFSVAVSSAPA